MAVLRFASLKNRSEERMKLISGKPFWNTERLEAISAPTLDHDLTCDVVILGAGITGALIADALSRDGLDVVVIDKNQPGRGSTIASTSLLMYELDVPLHKLSGMIGTRQAARVYRMGIEAIGQIGKLASELPTDCSFRMKPSVYLSARHGNVADLRAEFDARRGIGIHVDWLSRSDIASRFSFERHAAILSHDAAEIDPARFALGLFQRSISHGVRIFGNTTLASATPTASGIIVRTEAGQTIRGHKLIHATGYAAAQYIGKKLATGRVTYAAATTPLSSFEGWWEQCHLWEAADPYIYLRTLPDGRAMIGGLDDRGLRFINDTQRQRRKSSVLADRFGKLFPRIEFDIAAAWAGVFQTTRDGMPYIGPHPDFPNSLFALGYGGNGITFAVMAANILRDVLRGRSNRDLHLFAFDRPSVETAVTLAG